MTDSAVPRQVLACLFSNLNYRPHVLTDSGCMPTCLGMFMLQPDLQATCHD